MDYHEYIESDEWKRKRCEKLGTDALILVKCEMCGGFFQKHKIHVDHLSYKNLGNDPLSDLQVLCASCHEVKHGRQFAGPDTRLAIAASQRTAPTEVAPVDAISTGLHDLDRAIGGGLSVPSLVALSARPNMGKSALLRTIALNVCRDGRKPTLFMSLESSSNDVAIKMLCAHAGVPCDILNRPYYNPGEQEALRDGQNIFDDIPLRLSSPSSATDSFVLETVANESAETGLRLFILDYVELVDHQGDEGTAKHERLADFLRRLRAIGRERGICTIFACNANRTADKRKWPTLDDVRCPDTMQTACDQIWLMWRPDYYEPMREERDRYPAYVGCWSKNGAQQKPATLAWLPKTTSFSNIESEAGIIVKDAGP